MIGGYEEKVDINHLKVPTMPVHMKISKEVESSRF